MEALGERFEALGAFARAEQLLDRLRRRARAVTEQLKPDAIRELGLFLVDLILS